MVARRKSGPISVKTIPSGSIAVPRDIAFRAARWSPGRKIESRDGAGSAMRARGSAELENARTPAARVGLARGRVAAAAAVAGAEFAVAPHVHAVDEFVAARFQPVGAAQLRRLQAAALGFVLAVVAEIVVGLELVLELAHAQFDHHR